MKSRTIFVAGAVFLSAALATNYLVTQPEEPAAIKLKPTEVLTWDCEFPEYKPKAITFTCASGGLFVDKIKWTSNFMNLDKIRGQQKNFSEHHEEA